MKKVINSVFMFLLAFLFLALGIVILPFSNINQDVLYFVVSIGLIVYTFGYLLRVSKKSDNNSFVITIVEMILFTMASIISLGAYLGFYYMLSESILGITIVVASVCELLRAYYTLKKSIYSYPVFKFILNIAILILGSFIILSDGFFEGFVLYMLSVTFLIISVSIITITIIKLTRKKHEGFSRTLTLEKD